MQCTSAPPSPPHTPSSQSGSVQPPSSASSSSSDSAPATAVAPNPATPPASGTVSASASSTSLGPRYRLATQVVTLESSLKDPYNPASTPIYQTATFKQTSADAHGEYDYTRSGNPTRTALGKIPSCIYFCIRMFELSLCAIPSSPSHPNPTPSHGQISTKHDRCECVALEQCISSDDRFLNTKQSSETTEITQSSFCCLTCMSISQSMTLCDLPSHVDCGYLENHSPRIRSSGNVWLCSFMNNVVSLEKHVAKLCGAHRAFAVSSGMSALDVITRLVRTGQEIVAGTDIYGGTNRLLKFLEGQGIHTKHVDTTDLAQVAEALGTNTRLVLLETPTNPLIRVADIAGVVRLTRERAPNALVVVDNTMMSPYLQRPLELGVDIEYHSGTKYLCGHHDLMAGVIAVSSPKVADDVYFIINASGCGLAPFDCWLLLRGIKTLGVRMEKQQQNAHRVAQFLESTGLRVHYPGLASFPQKALHDSQSTGAGAVLSFETGSTETSQLIVEACKLFSISVSFGCVNSLISMPCRMSHASIPAHVRKERALPEDLIRLCIGIEDAEDLVEDLHQALVVAKVAAPVL
ncbi:cystathionine beta-lyase [Capsaspora owczarzaki ATCC 30864]|uniref:cysteine-S-conjugate beta-lyase n=1 Tax=Capsaspora owczarzaki (strain ATCC 30864) TaxID=595528 RepID=A0A0D2UF44_CAPO3|nr:cystathionine beta-lyase [Capsaspora owczarzaki ATCC 30864]